MYKSLAIIENLLAENLNTSILLESDNLHRDKMPGYFAVA
jgi:hypothetical protein